ncbi:ATP-binding protein [Aureimonas ureilytica]|uniref:ATP-binding protein n=1 Tax=Aureimonas ureilytica TaxID=401562 RepID=UPI0003655FC5|nr:AAA family ATPase [Aureimonas ureilytica]
MSNVDTRPRWVRDLARFLPLKSQFVLTGNVRDLQIRTSATAATAASLTDVIVLALADAGYEAVVRFDPVSGFSVLARPDGTEPDAAGVLGRLGLTAPAGIAPAGIELLGATLERLVRLDGPPIALVADFASRLVNRADTLSPQEQQLFTRALVAGQSAKARPVGPNRAPRFNTVIWIADREGDLPDWLIIDNPRLRHIPIAPPDRAARSAVAPSLVRGLPGAREADPVAVRDAEDALVDATEGMLLVDLNSIAQLARAEGVGIADVGEAVRRYKVGVTEDAWRKLERGRIRNGADFVSRRAIGQDHAVVHMLDIVKRAATGLGSRGGRPRGIAFLAGPTGVGKTELAKTVTELLYGDESAYIRFDMSEFSAEHADQRLIGAPPGYVGYDVGGELTNAVRERPFSVVLFDEIEKAHPRITDGAFSGLSVGYDRDDRPVILSRRRDGTEVQVDALSEGTRDQLFLALRLGSIDGAAGAAALPIVCDDLLITADDARAASLLRVLGTAAKRNQVIVFSHHDHLVDVATRAVGSDGFRLHRIAAGGGSNVDGRAAVLTP